MGSSKYYLCQLASGGGQKSKEKAMKQITINLPEARQYLWQTTVSSCQKFAGWCASIAWGYHAMLCTGVVLGVSRAAWWSWLIALNGVAAMVLYRGLKRQEAEAKRAILLAIVEQECGEALATMKYMGDEITAKRPTKESAALAVIDEASIKGWPISLDITLPPIDIETNHKEDECEGDGMQDMLQALSKGA